MHLSRSASNVPHLPSFFDILQNPHVLLAFDRVYNPLRLPRETAIWTSKSGPSMWCFSHFDFDMCFAPHRCALFRHRNFQKWREHVVFLTFWLRNALRATTACTFSTSLLPKVVRTWCVLYILTSTCALRHNGVHFFDSATSKIAQLLSWECFVHFDLDWLGNVLRVTTACNFSSLIWPAVSAPATLASLLFDPLEPQILGKTQCFATFLPFSRTWIFFLPTLSLLWSSLSCPSLFCSSLLPSSAPPLLFISLSILSEVWLLNFLR